MPVSVEAQSGAGTEGVHGRVQTVPVEKAMLPQSSATVALSSVPAGWFENCMERKLPLSVPTPEP